jgi:c(7)-type cytochrome triheme protein
MAQQAVAVCTGVLLLAFSVTLALHAQPPLVARLAVSPPAPVQPLPYSHRQHLAIGLTCRYCHVNPDAGPLMTFPSADTCLTCHKAMPARAATLKALTESHTSGTPIPWVRVYRLADFVYWSHATHIESGITCETCHGPVAERDVMMLETNITTKQGCVTCHEARQVFTGCGDCHEPRQ